MSIRKADIGWVWLHNSADDVCCTNKALGSISVTIIQDALRRGINPGGLRD